MMLNSITDQIHHVIKKLLYNFKRIIERSCIECMYLFIRCFRFPVTMNYVMPQFHQFIDIFEWKTWILLRLQDCFYIFQLPVGFYDKEYLKGTPVHICLH